jgi:hypothetical protein
VKCLIARFRRARADVRTQLMQEADIRLLDLRHTLPNLKNVLLTLSSPLQNGAGGNGGGMMPSRSYVVG